MDVLELLSVAFPDAFSPGVIVFAALGVLIGITVGAIPGLSGDLAIAIVLPIVFTLSPTRALGMLIGIYKGSMFGGSISAISFGVPGTAAAAATVEDGFKAKQRGVPKQALFTGLYSSVTGDVISSLTLIFLALPMARIALMLGPAEFFALYVFSLMLIAFLTQGHPLKGVAAAAVGLLLGAVGMDPMAGSTRLTFGISQLRGGLPLVPVLVGVFAISELVTQFRKAQEEVAANHQQHQKGEPGSSDGVLDGYDESKDKMSLRVYLSTLRATIVGSITGTFIGALPGAGSSLAGFMAYGLGKRFSKTPEEFGKGSLEGVAAPESGNSATCGASMVPLFAFGIPGSATAALIGAALIMQGITPGPRMIAENAPVMYAFFIVLVYSSFMNLGLSRLLIPLYARLSMIKGRYLVPVVFILALLGTFSARNSVMDVWILLIMGVLGYLLRRHGFPMGPLVLAFILGPGTERSLRQALLIARGDITYLFSSPISIGFYAIAVMFMLGAVYTQRKGAG